MRTPLPPARPTLLSVPSLIRCLSSDAPVSFSQSVLDSLQRSPEVSLPSSPVDHQQPQLLTIQTDRVRAHDIELRIQSRVQSELTRLRDAHAQQLEDLTARLTTHPPADLSAPSQHQLDAAAEPIGLFAHLRSPFYQAPPTTPDSTTARTQKAIASDLSHDSVEKEIMDLRRKLEARKKVEQMSPEVAGVRERLVQCLRINDRRPLDCWQEVEQFKMEVGKLEQEFVRKVTR